MGWQHFLFGRWQHFVKTMGQSYGVVVLKRHTKGLEYVCLKFMGLLIFFLWYIHFYEFVRTLRTFCEKMWDGLIVRQEPHSAWFYYRNTKNTPAGSYLYAPLRVLVKFWLSLKEIDVGSHGQNGNWFRFYLISHQRIVLLVNEEMEHGIYNVIKKNCKKL